MLGRRVKGTPPASGAFNPALPQPLQGTKEAFRPDFDLTHPKDWPTWLQNCHTENAAVEVRDGKIIWWGGSFHDGLWMDGYWMGGVWRDGIWLDGVWHDGRWCYGEWRGGTFLRGMWQDGLFRAGRFEGTWYGGLWLGGDFNGFRERSTTPPVPWINHDVPSNHQRIVLGIPGYIARAKAGDPELDQPNPANGDCPGCGHSRTILYPHHGADGKREYLCGDCEAKRLEKEVGPATPGYGQKRKPLSPGKEGA